MPQIRWVCPLIARHQGSFFDNLLYSLRSERYPGTQESVVFLAQILWVLPMWKFISSHHLSEVHIIFTHWVIVLLALDRGTLRIVEDGVHGSLPSTVPSRHWRLWGTEPAHVAEDGPPCQSACSPTRREPPRAGSPGSLCQKQALKLVFLHF